MKWKNGQPSLSVLFFCPVSPILYLLSVVSFASDSVGSLPSVNDYCYSYGSSLFYQRSQYGCQTWHNIRPLLLPPVAPSLSWNRRGPRVRTETHRVGPWVLAGPSDT